jgi:hypothetical protein
VYGCPMSNDPPIPTEDAIDEAWQGLALVIAQQETQGAEISPEAWAKAARRAQNLQRALEAQLDRMLSNS